MSSRLPRAGQRTTRGRITARMTAAKKVRNQSASMTPTAPMTKTDSADPPCMKTPRITTKMTAVSESRAAVGGGGAGGARAAAALEARGDPRDGGVVSIQAE